MNPDELNQRADERLERERLLPKDDAPPVPIPNVRERVNVAGIGISSGDKGLMEDFHDRYAHVYCMEDGGGSEDTADGSSLYALVETPGGVVWSRREIKHRIRAHVTTISTGYGRELVDIRSELLRQDIAADRRQHLEAREPIVRKLYDRTTRGSTIATVANLLESHLFEIHGNKRIKMNPDPLLLNFTNGVVDLRTGEHRKSRPEDYITKSTHVWYNPAADYSWWEKIVMEIVEGDRERYDFLHEWFGYCATGLRRENAFLILHGPGANGKSLLLDAIGTSLGGYAVRFLDGMLEEKGASDNSDLFGQAALYGARLAYGSESAEGRSLKSDMVKKLTGDQSMSVRRSRENPIEVPITFKLVLATNFTPELNATDDAIHNRLRLFGCRATFGDEHAVSVGRAKYLADLSLGDRIKNEQKLKQGILRWLVEGARKYLSRPRMHVPDSVRRESDLHRRTTDPVGQFIEACLEYVSPADIEKVASLATPGGDERKREEWKKLQGLDRLMIERAHLYKMFVMWARDMGIHKVKIKSQLHFNQYLQTRPRVWVLETGGEYRMESLICKKDAKGVWWWRWLRLSEEGKRYYEEVKGWDERRNDEP